VAVQTITQRQRFAQSLKDSFHVSDQQWQPMDHILALTTASRFNIYAYYPHLFMGAFPLIDAEILTDLAWIGRCALDYVLLYDYLLDSGRLPDPVILLGSYAFQREYMTRLQRYFLPGSALWGHLSTYESETARALIEEQTQRQHSVVHVIADFSIEAMRRQAIGKAAISRLAIVALACLTDTCDSDIMRGVIASNDHYNFARQISDDLLDWRKDYETGRHSFLLMNALKFLGVTKDTAPQDYPPANRVGSMIYTQFAEEYLAAADTSLIEAARLGEAYHTGPDWLETLAGLRASISRQCAVLAEARKISKVRKPILHRVAQDASLDSLSSAIESAQMFLLQRQSSDGCWRDFATSAGESEDWVTGYVGWSLLSSGRLPVEAQQRAAQWLIESQFPQGGWGYHRHVVVDADSTAWCLRFLALVDQSNQNSSDPGARKAMDDGISVLLMHQHADGGFSTYRDPEPIRAYIQAAEDRDLSGWCMPQLCVTAAAMAALHETGASKSALKSGVTYSLRQQHGGFWHSYWWEGPHYATAHTLRALTSLPGNEGKAAVSAAHAWLRSCQQTDGSWGTSIAKGQHEMGRPFYTALALQGLLPDDSDASQNAIRQGVQWLIQHQESDGGWQASARLLLPETHDQLPWLTHDWPEQIQGTGIARRDHRRIFTTATALKALADALSQKPEVV
jgi:squalene cyclase